MRIPVMGVSVDAVTVDDLHAHIARARGNTRSLVFHVNAHALNLANRDPRFRAALNAADICFCDGAGVRLAARLAGYHLPRRITYADWIWDLARFSAEQELSWFLLGGVEGRAREAAAVLEGRVPGLSVVGTHHGYFDRRTEGAENRRVVAMINRAKPDVLLVAFGMPTQERWLLANWPSLDTAVGLTGGAVLDYVSGALRRAPRIFTHTGFEWLGRLLIEPRRLWRRYLLGNPVFLGRAVASAARHRSRRGSEATSLERVG